MSTTGSAYEKIDLVKNTIDNEDIDSLIEWLKTYPRLTKGPATIEFEDAWSKWIGCKYSVFVNSGSSAILLMLCSLLELYKLRNKKIVVPALCWSTDLAPVMQLGFEPILVDCNLSNLSVDIEALEKIFLSEKPAAMILVSVLGLCPQMDEIVELCKKHGVILLEDNCESQGTKFNGVKLGNFGLMSSYSTYFGHTMSCTKNTPIPYTDNTGQFKIDSIENVYEQYNKSPQDIQVLSFNSFDKNVYLKSPSEIIKHKLGDKKILKLTLKNNREVEITEDHSVFKFNLGIPTAIEGYNLKIGDKIIVPHNLPRVLKENNILDFTYFCRKYKNTFFVKNYNLIDYENYKPKWGTKDYKQKENYKKRNVLPLDLATHDLDKLNIAFKNTPKNKYIPGTYKITPEFCRLIGYFIAEGSYKKKSGLCFSFNAKETQYIKEVLKYVKDIFNIDGYTSTKENATQVLFDSTTLQFFFEKFLNIKRGALNKRIPDFIWHTSKENQLEFLYGFYLGDGTQDETRIEFASASKKLINDVAYLSSFLDLQGSLGIKVKPSEKTIYHNKNISKSNGIFNYRLYNVDFEDAKLNIKFKNRHTALICDNEIHGNLQELEIKKIEYIDNREHEYVYDFSVPDYENFIGGWQPICLHNSTIEGGMISTNDKSVYDMLKMIRSHGWDRDLDKEKQTELRNEWNVDNFSSLYTFYVPGFNVRSTDLQAVIGIRQLQKVDDMISNRNRNFQIFKEKLSPHTWFPLEVEGSYTASFCIPVIANSPEQKMEIVKELIEKNVECRPLICGSMGTQPFYIKKYGRVELPNVTKIDECGLYIPNHPNLTEEEINRMCDCIIKIVNK